MASTYLTRTTSTPTNDKIMTFSFWLKKEIEQVPIMSRHIDSNNRFQFYNLDSTSKIQLYQQVGGSVEMNLSHPRALRDFNGWYHWVIAIDTTQATDSNRVKIYINGELLSGYSTATYPAQNADILFNGSSVVQEIGRTNGSDYYRGSMSHFHFIDGTQYAASDFGSTDSTTGEWKINTSPSVTYGTNGFFILKDGNSVTDQSPNTNNFTVAAGTLTKTEDNPSNVFATWYSDSFDKGNQVSFSNGNTTTADAGGTSDYDPKAWTTLAANAGKYYCEMKLTAFATGRSYRAGVWFTEGNFSHESNANCFSGVKYTTTGNAVTIYSFGSDVQSGLTSFSAGDILGIAVDIDNGTIQYYRNGATYGSQITGLSSNFSGKSMMFCHTGEAGAGRTYTVNANFGNGYFGTTAVSSAGTNASNNGIFEYDVPTGYTALSTKGLNL
jgi:hypothetical protein